MNDPIQLPAKHPAEQLSKWPLTDYERGVSVGWGDAVQYLRNVDEYDSTAPDLTSAEHATVTRFGLHTPSRSELLTTDHDDRNPYDLDGVEL